MKKLPPATISIYLFNTKDPVVIGGVDDVRFHPKLGTVTILAEGIEYWFRVSQILTIEVSQD